MQDLSPEYWDWVFVRFYSVTVFTNLFYKVTWELLNHLFFFRFILKNLLHLTMNKVTRRLNIVKY